MLSLRWNLDKYLMKQVYKIIAYVNRKLNQILIIKWDEKRLLLLTP